MHLTELHEKDCMFPIEFHNIEEWKTIIGTDTISVRQGDT